MGTLVIGRNDGVREPRRECPLVYGDNAERRCVWCGEPLPKRRRRWCSDACGSAWSQNHSWTDARAAALKRDAYHCVRCGRADREWPELVWWWNMLRWWYGHSLLYLVSESWSMFKLIDRRRLEVNHKTPCLGAHAQNSCAHHLDGLETLCRPCHLDETRRQFGRRDDPELELA